jgi:hypothetical protein
VSAIFRKTIGAHHVRRVGDSSVGLDEYGIAHIAQMVANIVELFLMHS